MKMFDLGVCILLIVVSVATTLFIVNKPCIDECYSSQHKLVNLHLEEI